MIDSIEYGSENALLYEYATDKDVIGVHGHFDSPVSNNSFDGFPIIEKESRLLGYIGYMRTFREYDLFSEKQIPFLKKYLELEKNNYKELPKLSQYSNRPYLLMQKDSQILCLCLSNFKDDNGETVNWVDFFITDTEHKYLVESYLDYVWSDK